MKMMNYAFNICVTITTSRPYEFVCPTFKLLPPQALIFTPQVACLFIDRQRNKALLKYTFVEK